MRKVMLLLLLTGAAMPAIAAAEPMESSVDEAKAERAEPQQERQQERQQAREVQIERAEPSGGGQDRPYFGGISNSGGQGPAAAQVQSGGGGERRQQFGQFANDGGAGPAAIQAQADDGGRAMEARRQHFGGFRQVEGSGGGQDMAVQPIVNEGARSGEERSWGWRERRPMGRDRGEIDQQSVIVQDGGGSGSLRQLDRPSPYVLRNRVPVISSVPREGTQPPPRTGIYTGGQRMAWTGNWRNNQHYDWRNHRRHHRSLFHLGFYYDPFGWGYQPYSIGWRMWPSYYSSRYWLRDPYAYRLPYAPPGFRWIRYYDDALLVDTWSGEVVDVIYDFFW